MVESQLVLINWRRRDAGAYSSQKAITLSVNHSDLRVYMSSLVTVLTTCQPLSLSP
jgi:hypothetical protein